MSARVSFFVLDVRGVQTHGATGGVFQEREYLTLSGYLIRHHSPAVQSAGWLSFGKQPPCGFPRIYAALVRLLLLHDFFQLAHGQVSWLRFAPPLAQLRLAFSVGQPFRMGHAIVRLVF